MDAAKQEAETADALAQNASAAAQSANAAAEEARRSLRRDAEDLLPERFTAPDGPVQLTFKGMSAVLTEETAALHAAQAECTAALRRAAADCTRRTALEADRRRGPGQRPALEQAASEGRPLCRRPGRTGRRTGTADRRAAFCPALPPASRSTGCAGCTGNPPHRSAHRHGAGTGCPQAGRAGAGRRAGRRGCPAGAADRRSTGRARTAAGRSAGPADPAHRCPGRSARAGTAAGQHSCCPTALRQKNTAQPLPPAPSWNSAGSG